MSYWLYLVVKFYRFFVLLCFVLWFLQSLELGDFRMVDVVSVSLFILCFICLWSLWLWVTSAWKLLYLLHKPIWKAINDNLWIIFEKKKCFDFNDSFVQMINAELLSLFIHHHACLDHQNQQDDFHYTFLSLFL